MKKMIMFTLVSMLTVTAAFAQDAGVGASLETEGETRSLSSSSIRDLLRIDAESMRRSQEDKDVASSTSALIYACGASISSYSTLTSAACGDTPREKTTITVTADFSTDFAREATSVTVELYDILGNIIGTYDSGVEFTDSFGDKTLFINFSYYDQESLALQGTIVTAIVTFYDEVGPLSIRACGDGVSGYVDVR